MAIAKGYAPNVLDTTSISGTGAYLLDGPSGNRDALRDRYATGAKCLLWIEDDTGDNKEWGEYTLTYGSPDSLARTRILGSTNGDAAVDWPDSSVKKVYSAPLAEAMNWLLRGWGGADLLDLIAYSNDAGAAEGPFQRARRESVSAAANDMVGGLLVEAFNGAATLKTLFKIVIKLLDPTNASEDAEAEFHSIVAGALAARMVLGQGLRVGGSADPGAGKISALTDFLLGAKSLAAVEYALTDAATIAWDLALGPAARVTLGGNRTLGAPTNGIAGMSYSLRVIEDGTGNRTLAYNAAFKPMDDIFPIVAPGANKETLITVYYTGAKYLIAAAPNYS